MKIISSSYPYFYVKAFPVPNERVTTIQITFYITSISLSTYTTIPLSIK